MIHWPESKRWIRMAMPGIFFFLSACAAWAQTHVTGRVMTSDGMVAASGAVALEKGELHGNAFVAGGAVGPDGTFRIPLSSGGPWGLHVYSEKYIYFPLQINVTPGIDNDIPVILPVDGSSRDDPEISDIRFEKLSERVFRATMKVEDPDNNLGPQMLVIDTRRFRAYRMVPETGDLENRKAAFPNGRYVSPFIPVALDGEDLKDWLFVVADHQCSSGAIYNGLGRSIFRQPVAHSERLTCEVPGIWKSNFGKIYRFSRTAPGVLEGERFEAGLSIEGMVQSDARLSVDFLFEGKPGQAELTLECRENAVVIRGTFEYPGRSGDWVFTKLKNAEPVLPGERLFSTNCAVCHFPASRDRKVGPGLLGLFDSRKLPDSGLPVTEENLRRRIVNGGEKMPPFKHLSGRQLKDIIEFLKTL